MREQIVASTPFGNLLHFKRDESALIGKRYDPKVLIVAPMSGHYASLLRGTVQAMLPDHETYITDWNDARDIPLAMGRFDLDDFIDHVIEFIRVLGPDTHVIGVCQPAVPVLAAVAHMATIDDPCQPASMTLMGGPIDTRRNPDRRQQAWPKAARSTGSRTMWCRRCRSRTPASCARSIPASCSSPGS